MRHKKLIVPAEHYDRYLAALNPTPRRPVDVHTLGEIAQQLKDQPFIDDGCEDLDGTDEFVPGKGHTMSVGGKPHTTPHPTDTMPQELGMHGPLPDKLPAPSPQDAGLIVTPEDMKPPTAPK